MTGDASSEAELVARCRTGEPGAWEALVEHFARYVHAIAVRGYRLSPQDAEDVFQETFARTYEHLARLRSDDAIRPWIGQLTRRLCVDHLRATRRADGAADADEAAPDARLERIEEAMVVRNALGRLSPDCRDILDRFFVREQSYREIGAALDIPSGTIASRISRCLDRLRSQLDGRSDSHSPS